MEIRMDIRPVERAYWPVPDNPSNDSHEESPGRCRRNGHTGFRHPTAYPVDAWRKHRLQRLHGFLDRLPRGKGRHTSRLLTNATKVSDNYCYSHPELQAFC